MIRWAAYIGLGLLILFTAFIVGVVIAAGDYDRREEERLEQQKKEKAQQIPDLEVYDACWYEDDRKHCGLLEEDDET